MWLEEIEEAHILVPPGLELLRDRERQWDAGVTFPDESHGLCPQRCTTGSVRGSACAASSL
jgi:hypothetical protein